MWRREEGDRALAGLDDRQAIAGAQRHRVVVDRAAELVLLPGAARVAPDHALCVADLESPPAPSVLVGDRGLVGLGDRFLADEICPAIYGELQPP